jgi:hypothetical protein
MSQRENRTPERFVSRSELTSLLDGLLPLLNVGSDSKEWSFPVSRRCKVSISFSTEPGVDEWDSMLSHIAFYKRWFTEGEEIKEKVISKGDLIKLFEGVLDNDQTAKDEAE